LRPTMRKGIRWNPLGPGGDWHATGTQVACMDSDKWRSVGSTRYWRQAQDGKWEMSATRTVLTLSTVMICCLYAAPGSEARTTSYVTGFRAAYLPVVKTLHAVSATCPAATTV